MAVNKVELSDGTVLIDLSGSTVTPATLASGETAVDAKGDLIVGTLEATSGSNDTHVVTKDCDNAAEVVAYFKALLPSGATDMIVALKPSGVTAFSKMENGQMLTLAINGSKAGYSRWYSNAVNVQTTFTTSYTCKCFSGDEYYVIPVV